MSKKYDLKKQIKEMEDKARAEAMAAVQAPAPATTEEATPATVSFDQWWMMVNSKVSLKPYMKEIIVVDFKARGLSKNETAEKFDATLRVFGINVPQ